LNTREITGLRRHGPSNGFFANSSGVEAFFVGKPAPEISGGPWINTQPLVLADLRGQVVLVEFWTYG